jgi:hypothetical protein
MTRFLWLPLFAVAGCGSPPARQEQQEAAPPLTYDGATATQANARVAHGKRLSLVLGCEVAELYAYLKARAERPR